MLNKKLLKYVLYVFQYLTIFLLHGELMAKEALDPNNIEKSLQESMTIWNTPGVAVAIVKDGKIVFLNSYGIQEIETEKHVDNETLFSIGSLTKAFTATALAILVDEKKIQWDDPVTKHLPSFYLFNPYVTQNVTIRDLLSHRTGLAAHDGDLLWTGQPYSRKEIVNRSRYLTPTFGFRSTYAYQNVLYVTAGEIIEAVSGMTWDEFIKIKIFDPLKMRCSFSFLKSRDEKLNISRPHAEIEGSIQKIHWDSVENFGAAGSIVSCISDMAKWLILQLELSKGRDTAILKHEASSELFSPQINVNVDPVLKNLYPDSNFVSYGLGWFLHDYHGKKIIQHDGLINGMSAFLLMIPQEDFGIVVLSNLKDSLLPHSLSYQVMDTILGQSKHNWDLELHKTILELKREGENEENKLLSSRVKDTPLSHPISNYIGTYQDQLYGDVIIWGNDKDSLKAKVVSGKGHLEHWHYDTFRFIPEDKTLSKPFITFYFDSNGQIDYLKISPILPTSIFKFQKETLK